MRATRLVRLTARAAAGGLAVLTATAAAPAGHEQDPQQQGQFRTTVRVVPIYATVTDRSGMPIDGLTREDFEVLDNDEPQTITQFSADNVPLSALLLMDGSSSMLQSYDRVINGANSFIVRMLPDDRARIGSFAERLRLSPRFTSDRDELLRYTANEFNLVLGLATHLWYSMAQGVETLAPEPGKRVLLVLSDGYNWVSSGQASVGGGRRGRGRQVMPSISVSTGPATTEADVRLEAARQDVVVYAISMWVWFNGEEQPPNNALQQLALETGGGYFELREYDEVNSTFSEIARELRQGYVLGFVPSELDGRTHDLDVRVSRPGATVKARRTYVADAR